MLPNVLKRVDLLVLKNKSGTDAAQVPASGATVGVYEAGPVVSQTVVLLGTNTDPPPPPSQPIPVYDPRNVSIGDTVRLGPAGLELGVSDIQGTDIYVDYSLPGNTSVSNRTHLYVLTKRASLYADPYGMCAILSW
ncbi:MAG: hypothetical protein HZC42_01005 [Candidatus Eisenbacteria bacterium]|nr:hypothetical protein [Candidatus Eisenbacteria bacterium]